MKTTSTHQQNLLFTRVARLVGYLASAKAGAWFLAMILPILFSTFTAPSAAESVGAYPPGTPIWFVLAIPMIGAALGIFLFWAWARFDSLSAASSSLDDAWDRAAEMLRSNRNALGEGRTADTARFVLAQKQSASANMHGNDRETRSAAAKA